MKYAFIEAEREGHEVSLLCRLLGVPVQGFYQWRNRGESRRAADERRLVARIRVAHAESKRRYGSPRIHEDLVESGESCGKHRVARLMRLHGIRAKAAKKFRVTTDSTHGKPVAPNLLKRNFSVSAPNRAWVSDITYVWTDEGWMYLAVFIDLYSRMVVGWALSTRLSAGLVLDAYERALVKRRPAPGLMVHTDQGCQYASEVFRSKLSQTGAVLSMSRRGDCWDNAVAESFFHSFKVEAIYGERFESRRRLEMEVFDYIERFYNRRRRHSFVGGHSPVLFEKKMGQVEIAA